MIVTVDGHPIAQLGPLDPRGRPTIDDLAAAGLLRLPRRRDHPPMPDPAALPIDARVDLIVEGLRGTELRR